MTKNNKILKRIYITCICTLIITSGFFYSKLSVEAASKAKKAKNAYSKMLSKKMIKWSDISKYKTSKMKFACIDVNGDKVPELILQYDNAFGTEGSQRMYTYLNGKVKQVYMSGNCDGIGEIYPSRKVFINSGGRMGWGWKVHNVLKNGKVIVKAEQYTDIDNNKTTYTEEISIKIVLENGTDTSIWVLSAKSNHNKICTGDMPRKNVAI